MVLEIGYEQYKEFCSKLPCKDVFYFIKNLFVSFPNDENIYAVKYNIHKSPKKVYEKLVIENELIRQDLEEFLLGLPRTDNKTFIIEKMYKDNSFLIQL